MSEKPTINSVATEVIWIVGTVVVSYVAIAATRRGWKLGKTLVASTVSKVKS